MSVSFDSFPAMHMQNADACHAKRSSHASSTVPWKRRKASQEFSGPFSTNQNTIQLDPLMFLSLPLGRVGLVKGPSELIYFEALEQMLRPRFTSSATSSMSFCTSDTCTRLDPSGGLAPNSNKTKNKASCPCPFGDTLVFLSKAMGLTFETSSKVRNHRRRKPREPKNAFPHEIPRMVILRFHTDLRECK